MNYELRKYSFGETLGKGFNLYSNNFIPIILVSILCEMPSVILLLLNYKNIVTSMVAFSFEPSFFVNIFLVIVLNILSSAFLSAYIICLVSRKFLETTPTISENISTSILPFVLPVIGLSILVGLLAALGFIFFIIPGIIIILGYSIAPQVLVIEKRKVLESMRRSWRLTTGEKWRILGIVIVSYLIILVVNWVVAALFQALKVSTEALQYLNSLISALTSPLIACILVVVYFNIRIEKEGFNIEHLAQQFTLAEGSSPSVES